MGGNLVWVKYLGWHILAAPMNYKGDGTDDKFLEPARIDADLIELIALADQTEELNVTIVQNNDTEK